MTLARILQVKSLIEDAGWSLNLSGKDLYDAYEEQIVWNINYRSSKKQRKVIFQLVDDFGCRTENLADLFFFKIDGDAEEFYFYKIKSDDWRNTLERFYKQLCLISADR